jgi:hypothetical protein
MQVKEYIKEQVAIEISKQNKEERYTEMYENMGLHDRIAKQNGEILGLRKQIKEQVIAIAEQPEPKWYDNIPEQGVLCWCEGEHKGERFKDDIPCKRILARIDSYSPKPTAPRKDSFIANWGFLNREHWTWYENVQPLTNEEIEEFKR